jgi:hypothetical protein
MLKKLNVPPIMSGQDEDRSLLDVNQDILLLSKPLKLTFAFSVFD